MNNQLKKGYISHHNGKLYYELLGNGPSLVFIHGFSLDSRMWSPQVEKLKSNLQILTYDMRGYGKSSLPKQNYSHHEDLHHLLTKLSLKKVHLVGSSLGGEVAIDFTLAYPQMVASLTLLDSSVSGYTSTVDWKTGPTDQDLQQHKFNWLNHQVFQKTNQNPTAKKILQKLVSDYSGWHWFNKGLREKLLPPAINRLSEIKIPVTTVVGEMDLSYYHDLSKLIERDIPNSLRIVTPNTGHLPNMENPEIINDLISRRIVNMLST